MAAPRVLTTEEYLALEETLEERHELIDGQMVAMSGGTIRHSELPLRLYRMLSRQADASCRFFSGSAKVKLSATTFYYPDLTAVCGEIMPGGDRELYVTNPILVVEVLSPSTERFDRTQKLVRYMQLESLKEFLYILQDQPVVEHYFRTESGGWDIEEFRGLEAVVPLRHLGGTIPLGELFEGMDFGA